MREDQRLMEMAEAMINHALGVLNSSRLAGRRKLGTADQRRSTRIKRVACIG
jgi:hypothetical protein